MIQNLTGALDTNLLVRETLLVRRERENKGNKNLIINLNYTNNDTNYDYLYTTLIGLELAQLGLY